jgi:hypothetical protein
MIKLWFYERGAPYETENGVGALVYLAVVLRKPYNYTNTTDYSNFFSSIVTENTHTNQYTSTSNVYWLRR